MVLKCQGSIVSKISSYQVHAFSRWGIGVPLSCENNYLSSLLSRVFIKVLLGGKSFGVGGDGKKLHLHELLGRSGGMPPGKILKSGLLGMHFQHSAAKMRVCEQNRDIIKFWLFHSVTAHEYSIF